MFWVLWSCASLQSASRDAVPAVAKYIDISARVRQVGRRSDANYGK